MWTPLNWRAIIPLYVQGYSVKEIESLVSLEPWEKLMEHMLQVDHTRWRKFAYAKPSVQSIIDFYHTALDKHEKYYTGKHLALTAAEQQGRFENSEKTFYQVIEELEQGHWEPGGEFPGMNHPYFWRHNQRFNNLDKIISGSIADKKPIGKSIRKRWKLT